jgi:tetratricopeptide (TPR) repeat protein
VAVYDAFISYSRADRAIVDDIHSRLSKFRTPSSLIKAAPERSLPGRFSIFLDRKSLHLGGSVPDRLKTFIQSSRFLVVFCSAQSASSIWVREEIELFLNDNPIANLLPVFLGSPNNSPIEDRLPEPLKRLGDDLPLGADMVLDGGARSVSHKIIGALLDLPQDLIAREQERADRRRKRLERTVLVGITGLASLAAVSGWIAYSEAEKAKKTLAISLDALDQTIPFAERLVRQGTLRIDATNVFRSQLESVFESYVEQDLQNLPDIRYKVGQLMLRSSVLNGISGEAERQADAALRAMELLQPFTSEPGPAAQLHYCDAAAQTSFALRREGLFREAMSALETCEAVLFRELGRKDTDNQQRAALLSAAITGSLARASLEMDRGRYGDADRLLADDYLIDDLQELAELAPALGAQRIADFHELRGTLLQTLERFGEAEDAFSQAVSARAAAGTDPLNMVPLQSARLVASANLSSDKRATAIEGLSGLIHNVRNAVTEDPGFRYRQLLLAELLLARAKLAVDDADMATADFSTVITDYEDARDILLALIEFDENNALWAFEEVKRLVNLGEMRFRLGESFGPDAPMCGPSCFGAALTDFADAHDRLGGISSRPPEMIRYQGEIELRIARTLRRLGRDEVPRWLSAAERTLDTFRATSENERSAVALEARIHDERADYLAWQEDHPAAADYYLLSLEAKRAAVEAEPEWITARRDLLWTTHKLAETRIAAGDVSGGRDAYAEACRQVAELDSQESWLIGRDIATVREAANALDLPCPVGQ